MTGGGRRWWGAVLAGVVLLAGGWGYRVTAAAVNAELAAPIRLDPPLSALPLAIGDWRGRDVEVPSGVQRIARNDDFVNRAYVDSQTGSGVNLYIGYTARPRTMLRHRPTVCYPSAGWSHVETHAVEVAPAAGERAPLPALVHTFSKTDMSDQRVVVLNYYVLNGHPTIDEHSFWGLTWRDPNLQRDAGRYVAQVQISSPVRLSAESAERAVRAFASASAPAVLTLLPATVPPQVP